MTTNDYDNILLKMCFNDVLFHFYESNYFCLIIEKAFKVDRKHEPLEKRDLRFVFLASYRYKLLSRDNEKEFVK